MNVGVLALQGDVSEHVAAVGSAMRTLSIDGGVSTVRRPSELGGLDALLMPGGESTTMAGQMARFGLREPVIEFASSGNPVMGTCAGAILLSAEIVDRKGVGFEPLGLIDMSIRRNAFGRQADSFERPVNIKGLDGDFPGIFIRAPRIVSVGSGVESLAMLGEEHVMVRRGNLMALTFHPELAGDDRVHALFLGMLIP